MNMLQLHDGWMFAHPLMTFGIRAEVAQDTISVKIYTFTTTTRFHKSIL